MSELDNIILDHENYVKDINRDWNHRYVNLDERSR